MTPFSLAVNKKSPQIYRQIQAVRNCLLAGSALIFVLTLIVIITRVSIQPGYELSLLLQIPLLATLGMLPVGSFFIFFLEIIGTARILTFIHPFTSQHSIRNYDPQSTNRKLFWKYCLRTLRSRFFNVRYLSSPPSLISSSSETATYFLPIPPANSYFLEKLGVVTALALIDDELACEPHSTPQQLLIPSENGLKLLDLYPSYDDDFDEDDPASSYANHQSFQSKVKRGASFASDHDMDSDDSDLEYQAVVPSKRRRQRKKNSDSTITYAVLNQILTGRDMESNVAVQFEDPSW